MSDREIVHTFFHELALHAGGIAQDKVGIGHGTTRVDELKEMVDRLLPTGFDTAADPVEQKATPNPKVNTVPPKQKEKVPSKD